MTRYICTVCDYIYDPEIGDEDNGIKAGTEFIELPDNWVCPLCGASKEEFDALDEDHEDQEDFLDTDDDDE